MRFLLLLFFNYCSVDWKYSHFQMKENTSCTCRWNHESSLRYKASISPWFCIFPSLVFIIILSNKFHLHIFHFLVTNNMGNFILFLEMLNSITVPPVIYIPLHWPVTGSGLFCIFCRHEMKGSIKCSLQPHTNLPLATFSQIYGEFALALMNC